MRSQLPSEGTPIIDVQKSVHETLNGNVSPGNGLTFDSSNQPLTYSPDNMSGRIIRIGSTANPHMLEYAWTGSNTDLTFAHNLNKVPYGYLVIAKTGPCDVYWGTVMATKTDITLRNTDGTQDTSIWILA